MSLYRHLADALEGRFDPKPIPAQLGYNFTGEDFIVMVEGDSTMYWARYNGTFGKVRHRGRVGPAPHAWVNLIYEQDGKLSIKESITDLNKQYIGADAGMIEGGLIPNNRFFGGSPLDLRMILQLELKVVSGLEIKYLKGFYLFEDVLYAWDSSDTLDLTSLLPADDLNHLWAVVGLKTDVTPHELYMAAGAEQSVGVDLDFAGLATVVNDEFLKFGYIPLEGVRLRYAQTKVQEPDFESVRTVSMPVRVTNSVDDTLIWLHYGW